MHINSRRKAHPDAGTSHSFELATEIHDAGHRPAFFLAIPKRRHTSSRFQGSPTKSTWAHRSPTRQHTPARLPARNGAAVSSLTRPAPSPAALPEKTQGLLAEPPLWTPPAASWRPPLSGSEVPDTFAESAPSFPQPATARVIGVEVLLQQVRNGLQVVVVRVVLELILTAMPLVRVRLRVVLVGTRHPSPAARAAANTKRRQHWPRWNAKSARVEWTAVMWRAMPLVRVRLRVVLVSTRRPSSAARAPANAKRRPHWLRWNAKTARVAWTAALPTPAAVRSASSWRQPRPGISTILS